MSAASTRHVALALTSRSVMRIYRVPATFVPSLVMPIFLVTAFSGVFASITRIPGFPVDDAIDWMLPMAIIQGSAFAGITTSLGVARDLEDGFFDRLLVAPVRRRALLLGPLLASAIRALVPFALVLTAGVVVGGAHLRGGVLGVVTLLTASVGISIVAGLWGLVVALKFKNQSAASLTQIVVFIAIFLSTAQVPLEVMTGWLHAVARINPMTFVFALARTGFLGHANWHDVWPGLIALGMTTAVLGALASRQLKRAIP
jgi:ABC-type multidrug transport system permease subunit